MPPQPHIPQSALKDFWSFASDVRSVTAWTAKASVAAPLIDIILGFGPPWPTRTGVPVLTSIVETFVLMYTFVFWKRMPLKRLTTCFRGAVILIVITFILYIMIFSFFVYNAPSPDAREIKGFLYRPPVQELIDRGESVESLINSAGYV